VAHRYLCFLSELESLVHPTLLSIFPPLRSKEPAITGVTLPMFPPENKLRFMRLNALLVCREPQSLRVLAAAMDTLGIEQEVCVSAPQALELLAQRFYSALMVDFDLLTAAQLVRLARMAPAQRRPVVFATIGACTDVGGTYQSGANFVLYKPLLTSQVLRSLRAGRGFMQPDRRRSPRHKMETLVYLRLGDVCSVPALVLNVSERGLAVQAAEPLPAGRLPLRFILPGNAHLIEGSGEVIWADEGGRAGILFSELSASSVNELKTWLNKRTPNKGAARAIPGSPRPRPTAVNPQ
jgi:ActR/RegA family two-component response regulator